MVNLIKDLVEGFYEYKKESCEEFLSFTEFLTVCGFKKKVDVFCYKPFTCYIDSKFEVLPTRNNCYLIRGVGESSWTKLTLNDSKGSIELYVYG